MTAIADRGKADRRVQLMCCYALYVFMALFGIGWFVLAGFVPPPRPAASAAEIARQLRGNATGIRVGMVISMFAAALLLPCGGVVCAQMRRIDARGGALVWAWIAAHACFVLEFIFPCAFWCVAAFRLGDPPASRHSTTSPGSRSRVSSRPRCSRWSPWRS